MAQTVVTDGRADRQYTRNWDPREWRDAQSAGGKKSGETRRAKSAPQRDAALKRVAAGERPEDIAADLGVSARTVRRWMGLK